MAAESSHDEIVSSTEEPINVEWLIKIIKEHRRERKGEKNEDAEHKRPKILKVDETLRQIQSNDRCFDPSVVSFGPYHYGLPDLMRMEPDKNAAIAWFISLAKVEPANDITEKAKNVYTNFKEKVKSVSSPNYWYDYDELSFSFRIRFESESFMRMMFRDGCFILHFIHLVTRSSSDEYISKSSHHFNQASIVRDMFLLENQIPFPILKSLMSLLPDQEMTESSIMKFIFMVFLPSYEIDFSRIGCFRVMIWILKLFLPSVWKLIFHSIWARFKGAGKEPLHLLHVLREVLLGWCDSPDSACGSAGYLKNNCRPIRELKSAGIQVRRSRGMTLKHLKFKTGLFNSHLEIPQIIVDGSTRTRLLNLAAYEMCPDGPKDRTVASYICLLASLIDHAEDVNELQTENILLNRLGSSEDVTNLFNELAANLSPDRNAYAHVINGISEHYKRHLNHERMRIGEWIRQFKRTYFTSPWTFISLLGGISVLALTLLQTIYTIWAFYKTD